jgi:hypothetical protein
MKEKMTIEASRESIRVFETWLPDKEWAMRFQELFVVFYKGEFLGAGVDRKELLEQVQREYAPLNLEDILIEKVPKVRDSE